MIPRLTSISHIFHFQCIKYVQIIKKKKKKKTCKVMCYVSFKDKVTYQDLKSRFLNLGNMFIISRNVTIITNNEIEY